MKRTLSLVLALVMVLGSFSSVFAAEATTPLTAGEFLKEAGVLTGNLEGDLKLQDDLKRRDSVVLLSRLMDQEDEAKVFPSEDLKFDDITDSFYNGFVAWAVSNGIVNGKSETKFDPNGDLEARDFATMLLRVLGHEPVWAEALETAKELGLLEGVEVEAETTLTRGMMAVMTFNTLGTAMKDSTETLADKLGIEMPAPELSTDIEITSAVAVANNKVEVKVKEEVTASAADFTIVKKGTTTAVEVKDVVKESAKVFVLETEALVGGTAYTVTANGKTINFTGIAADKSAPKVVKVSAADTNTFDVEYTDKMDFATATDVKNYTVDKDLKVVSVELNAARKVATVTTDAAKRGMLYTITIQNVMNSDGIAMAKSSHKISAIEDRTPPRVSTVKVQNNRMIIVTFDDANGMAKATVEDLANYSINDLNITSVKAYGSTSKTVVLTTDTQVANKAYTLTIEGVKDGSVLANPLVKTTRALRGAIEDKTAPTVKADSIDPKNNNEVRITFIDNNAMDAASLEDIGNYVITYGSNEILPIYEAKAWDTAYPDGYSKKGVTLYTAPQDDKISYRLEVKGVKDEFGNELRPVSGSTYAKYYFRGSNFDNQAPFVTSVKYVDQTTVKLTFNEELNRSTAIDPTNYVINAKIDTVIKASLSTDALVVTLTTQPLADNSTYTITMNNIEDEYANATINAKATFIATASGLDTIAPSLVHSYAVNNREIHLNFDEAVTNLSDAVGSESKVNVKLGSAAAIELKFKGYMNNRTTAVFVADAAIANTGTYDVYVSGANEFKDAAGNSFKPALGAEDRYEVYIYSGINNEAPRVDYIEQVDTKTLKVVFDEPVKGSGSLSKISPTSRDTHFTEWYYTQSSNFVVGRELKIDFTAIATDFVGARVFDANDTATNSAGTTNFTPWYEDLTAPTIVDVRAIDSKTIAISYDEDLSAPGRYRVYYYDNNNNRIPVAVGDTGSVVDNEVIIKVTGNPLQSYYTYELEVMTGARDIAGNREEVITGNKYDFYGSDVTTGNFITGVKILNAKKVEVTATKDIANIVVYEVYKDTGDRRLQVSVGSSQLNPGSTNAKVQFVDLGIPVLAGYDYEVEVSFVTGDPETYSFAGITQDRYITLTKKTNGSVELNFDGYSDEYRYDIFDEDLVNPAISGSVDEANKAIAGLSSANLDDVFYVLLYRVADGVLVNAAKVEVK